MRNINTVTTKKSDNDESAYSFSFFHILTLRGSDFALNNISKGFILFALCIASVKWFGSKRSDVQHTTKLMKDVQGECNDNFAPR